MAIGVAGCALLGACTRQTPARQSAEAARLVSALATSPEQARLWRDAADRGLAPGLERLPIVERPIQRQVLAQAVSQPVAVRPVVIPPGVVSAVRVVAAPAIDFTGIATVLYVTNERLELDFGQQRTLGVLVRAGGRPIPASAGEQVQVDYRVRSDPHVPRDVVAIKMASGNGIVSVVQGGDRPVTASVPLFDLSAKQIGQPPSPTVDVGVGASHRTMTAGETAQVGGLTVTLLASSAHTGDAGRIEGSPYSINLIGWRSPN